MSTAVEPTSHTVELRGLRLHYLDWANEGAPPLILLHGMGGTAREWRRVAEHLQPTYHVIALDQRGHGESEHATDRAYSTDDFVADLESLADALGFDRFILCGHSMGGHNTIAYTARHPERVVCALVNDIPPAYETRPQETAKRFPDGRQPVFASIEEFIDSRREQSTFTPEELRRLSAESRLRPVEGGYQPKADPNASIFWAPADLWEEARTITRPMLIIRGGQAEVLDAETLQRMDATIEPARSVTLEQSGHNTFFDMEQEFLSAASQFFAAHSG